jgi:Flp pilus assembly secretin CpaC
VEYQSSETELVVLVTPELVEPLTPDQVAYIPGNNMTAPNDAELFLEGRLEGRRGAQTGKDKAGPPTWPVRPGELYGSSLGKLRGPVGPSGSEEEGG